MLSPEVLVTFLFSDISGSGSPLHTVGNRPEASRHLCGPCEAAKTQPQPSSANRVRASLRSVVPLTCCSSVSSSVRTTQLNSVSVFSSSSNPEPQTPYRASYSHEDNEAEYRRQLAEQTKRGYYNPQKYKDTEL